MVSKLIKQNLNKLKPKISTTSKYILTCSAIALSVKLLLQLVSTIPSLSNLAFGFRPIVIGYLHLVLLGVIGVTVYGYYPDLFMPSNPEQKIGFKDQGLWGKSPAEIKDLCAWLRLWVNGDDDPAFLRAVTSPKRGIGHQTLANLGEFASKWKVSLFEALFAESLATALPRKAIDALHEFGRYVNDLEFRARSAEGEAAARELLMGWLKDIGYEQHLHDGDDDAKLAAARWSNVLDFVDWIARRCGGVVANDGSGDESPVQSVLQVAQTISIIISIAERGDDTDVVTLSTLHAAKGLEWPHVLLAGVNEGSLPFASEADPVTPQRLEEERRLMYVGVTRARQTLAVSSLKRRKRAREMVVAMPSRFVAEMKLDEAHTKVDPRERLRQLRAELAAKVARPAEAAP